MGAVMGALGGGCGVPFLQGSPACLREKKHVTKRENPVYLRIPEILHPSYGSPLIS